MTKSLLIASLFAIALTACSKKEEAPAVEVVTPPAAETPAAEAPATEPAAPAAEPAAPAADAPAEAPAATEAPAAK
ncbi:hypothetical protein [Oxalicibacterium flavum]|uniref:hypothetical protein n=1 Tax=Oxalicibacterium flavum TaxID=179467 RepID=UPI0016663ACD|nr:hypothetical protein [Oxalicibacterium flavum]